MAEKRLLGIVIGGLLFLALSIYTLTDIVLYCLNPPAAGGMFREISVLIPLAFYFSLVAYGILKRESYIIEYIYIYFYLTIAVIIFNVLAIPYNWVSYKADFRLMHYRLNDNISFWIDLICSTGLFIYFTRPRVKKLFK